MSYQALYRVWRPQTFDEIVGQKTISDILKNAVCHDQLSHAYLFTGPRGTGKTSAAKILAKAANCLNPQNGNPCNECQMCQRIDNGQASDIHEIDAASNNGVDEIRDLRENVNYAATEGTYKVYIIDEVHMLTTGAFNALLKTLEEPPANVIFILATTEPHKIPATIISRTQRFDFRRIDTQAMINHLQKILEHYDMEYDTEALNIIARVANGGLRDALSLLDQALSLNSDKLSKDIALEVSGSFNQIDLLHYLKALETNDSEKALEIVREQFEKGKQANRFLEDLMLFIRDMLLTEQTESNYTLLTEEELTQLNEFSNRQSYYQLIDHLSEAQQALRFTNQAEMHIEMLTIQLAHAIKQPTGTQETNNDAVIEPLKEQITLLNRQIELQQNQIIQLKEQLQAVTKQPINNQTNNDKEATRERTPRERPQIAQTKYQLHTQDVYHVLNLATKEAINQWKANWKIILNQLPANERRSFNHSRIRAAGGGFIILSSENELYAGNLQHNEGLIEQFERIAERVFNQPICLISVTEQDWPIVRKNYIALRERNHNEPIELNDYIPPKNERLITESAIVSDEQKHSNIQVEVSERTELEEDNASDLSSISHELEDDQPEWVSKAIDLFGEENITIVNQATEISNIDN